MSQKNDSIYGPIAYSPKKDFFLFLLLILIIWLICFSFKYWVQLSFNIIMVGYYIFKEMRGATIFFAIILRLLLYPLGRAQKSIERKTESAEEELAQKVKSQKHPLNKDEAKRKWLKKYRSLLLFQWLVFGFYTMNAFSVGWIFLKPFTQERVSEELFTNFLMPIFPLNTTSLIPLVGFVDLTQVNMLLNLISAIGAGLVGLIEVVLHNKTSRKQLIMYLVLFPLGAYFITMWVPSGFEFTLTVFEILTILIIIIEKLFEFGQKINKPKDAFNPAVVSVNTEVK